METPANYASTIVALAEDDVPGSPFDRTNVTRAVLVIDCDETGAATRTETSTTRAIARAVHTTALRSLRGCIGPDQLIWTRTQK